MSSHVDSCLRLAERVGLDAASRGSNFVFSPLSIRAALSLAAVGSRGETQDQMLSFLGSPTLADLNAAAGRLVGSVRVGGAQSDKDGGDGTGGPRLSFINGVWVDRSLELKPAFQEVATSVYAAVAKSADFQNQALGMTIEVNDWVEKETKGLIKDLIPEHAVNHYTRLILANALYFKGLWADKFDSSQTKIEEFHLLNGRTIQVPFMTSKEDQYVSCFDGFKVLKLPYQQDQEDKRFSMLIFLPHKKDGLNELIYKFVSDPNFIERHIPKHQVEVGKYMIPKFKISFGFQASDVLVGLGLESPFTTKADFQEMVSELSPEKKLFVSSMHHKATIEVEEEGTEAAAASAMVIRFCCYTAPTDFVANHPFAFVIREEMTGSMLFFGHVVNPMLVDQV